MSRGCHVCEAADNASDDTLASLVRRQAVTIGRLRANVDTFALAAARAELREARETIERLNRTRPQAVAVEVCREVAATDPRDPESFRCLWCGLPQGAGDEPRGDHRKDCAWNRSRVVAAIQAKDETKATVRRWSA